MKKSILIVALLAWFFGTRFESEKAGVYVTSLYGPFDTEGECKDYLDETEYLFDLLGLDAEVTKCKEMTDV